MAKKKEIGYVYIFTNESFRDGWVKIGKTTDIKERLKQLDNTSCPLPFDVFATLKTRRYDKAEKFVHEFISHFNQSLRIRPNREYFKVDPQEALNILIQVKELMDEPESEIITYNNGAIKNVIKKVSNSSSNRGEPSQKGDGESPRLSSLSKLPSYLTNLNSKLTREVMQEMGMTANIADLSDVKALQMLREKIREKERVLNYHNTHSCAISQYIKYLQEGLSYSDFEHDASLVKANKKVNKDGGSK
jgi:hypothetical protein